MFLAASLKREIVKVAHHNGKVQYFVLIYYVSKDKMFHNLMAKYFTYVKSEKIFFCSH